MTQTEKFIDRLRGLKEGDLSLLRRSKGSALDANLPAFDLFTGLWWPLRQESPQTPQRWCAWLAAKLYGSFPFPASERPLATAVGLVEPRIVRGGQPGGNKDRDRFRGRFDATLTSPGQDLLLEPHLCWCLREIADRKPRCLAINWPELLDDLWRWERPLQWRNRRLGVHARRHACLLPHFTVQEVWACEYLNPVRADSPDPIQGADHAQVG